MSRIFINYRRQDSEGYVGRLYDHLLKHYAPHDIFMDVRSIEPGADFVQVLEDAVAACDVFISVIGPQWSTLRDDQGERRIDQWNDFVRIEIASALKQNKLVIPVLVGRAKMPSPAELPDDLKLLARRNAIELSHQRFGADVEDLINFVRSTVPSHPSFKRQADSPLLEKKRDQLKALRAKLVAAEDSPLYAYRTAQRLYPVLGEGNPDANILFVGEAPGKFEAEQGVPFVGPSGDILDEMLATVGLARADVFVTNIVLDRLPENREPNPDEIAYYGQYLNQIIEIIEPALIVTLGRFAMGYVLKKYDLAEKRGKISELHGKLLKTRAPYGDLHIVPLYHPAVVLYSMTKKDTLREDFGKLKLFI
jgi:DNA polymerase